MAEHSSSERAVPLAEELGAQLKFGRVRRLIEEDIASRVRAVFDDVEDEPFALALARPGAPR
jgi:hypothetical protein